MDRFIDSLEGSAKDDFTPEEYEEFASLLASEKLKAGNDFIYLNHNGGSNFICRESFQACTCLFEFFSYQ